MGWQEHQAIVVAHTDKRYAHAHVMVTTIHPETGLKLDDNFERRRTQEWALEYELAQDRVHCQQRLKQPEDREKAAPRNIWMAFQQNERNFERAENQLEKSEPISIDDVKNRKNSEWQMLKQIQRDERGAFFAEGKSEFSQLRNSIYREVRGQFRDRWSAFYASERAGADPESLAALKAGLVSDQKAVLHALRDEAFSELRESRDMCYRALLNDQREARATLHSRQNDGLDGGSFLEELRHDQAAQSVGPAFAETAREVTTPHGAESGGFLPTGQRSSDGDEPFDDSREPRHWDVGDRLSHGVTAFFGALGFDLINLGSAPRPKPRLTDDSGRKLLDVAAEEATKKREHYQREAEDEEWRKRRAQHRE
jgi:hypothetical protein